MFTGIVEEQGRVLDVRQQGQGRIFRFSASRILDDLKAEDSVAVNGVCLTATKAGEGFQATAVGETLSKTTLASLRVGQTVNLERAMLPSTRMGGHIVQGHVDCVGRITGIHDADPGVQLEVEFDRTFLRYVARTGSVCVSGVSLTVAREAEDLGARGRFRVALVPWTLEHTTLGDVRTGDTVNLEFDCLAKYVEQLLQYRGEATPGSGGLSAERLRELGF